MRVLANALLTLLALPFWLFLLLGLHYSIFTLVDHQEPLHQILKRVKRQRQQAARRAEESQSSGIQFSAKKNPNYQPTQTPHIDQLKKRLKESEKLPAPNIRKPAQQPQGQTIYVPGQSKLGEIAYNQLVKDLQRENTELHARQQQFRSTFSQYFSPNVLKYLEENRVSFEQINNQKYEVTVLFSDVRNYAAFAQQATPDQLVADRFELRCHGSPRRLAGRGRAGTRRVGEAGEARQLRERDVLRSLLLGP